MDEGPFDHLDEVLCEFRNDTGWDDETDNSFLKLIGNADIDIRMIGFTTGDGPRLEVKLTSRRLTGSEQVRMQEEMECV